MGFKRAGFCAVSLMLLMGVANPQIHAATSSPHTSVDASARWSEAKAKQWYAAQPWLVGANFLPADAINQLEMWQAASFHPEALPLLLVEELLRPVPTVSHTDDLATVLSVFSRIDTSHLPVTTPASPKKVIGLISRATLMRHYNQLIGGM